MLYKKYDVDSYKKNNWICSVGRFFTLGHGKKQEILIEAFKKLYDKNQGSAWQLHLVGGLGDEPTSIDFFKYLKEKSKNYPIFFHINVSGKEVEEIYLRSKIYWHATGFGEDENYQPIRFEHFGISPIEAMSAKCIPVLFRGGGLPEIIKTAGLDPDKNMFSSITELVENTEYFQNKNKSNPDWRYIFSQFEKFYTYEAFKNNFLKLINSTK
jgi:glycosyltransferase involved in cell wall biosynthesis